jgi:CubicO group peptidase (beta-lactamase class C family)
MSTVDDNGTRGKWQRDLAAAVAAGGLPGAALSVLDGDAATHGAAGVLNVETGVAATPGSLFLIGSITKVFTGALVMGLVEDGLLDLDDRVLERLPELRFADGPDPSSMTVRHLLSHTGGVESDQFEDFGRGDDALQRMVATMSQLPLQFTPGEHCAYSNAGYMILGRLVEVVLGTTFAQARRDRVLDPLGCPTATGFAEEAILHRAAAGHFPDAAGRPSRTPVWGSSRASEPDGMLCAASGEVLRLAEALMRALRGAESPLLSPATVTRMVSDPVAIPAFVYHGHYIANGLGVMQLPARAGRLYGHNGAIMGQAGFMRFNPDLGTAAVLLTNSFVGAQQAWDTLVDGRLGELLGATNDDPRVPGGTEMDLVGTYERLNCTVEVARDGDSLRLRMRFHGPMLAESGGWNPYADAALRRVAPNAYLAAADGVPDAHLVATADPEYVYFGSRLMRRTG